MKSKFSINLEVSLIEIIISILILAISGAIILNCFAMARFTQIKSNDKVVAGIKVQTIIELIKSTNKIEDIDNILQDYYSEKNIAENSITLLEYYDNNWEKCSFENKEYLLTVEIISTKVIAGNLTNIHVSIEKVKSYPFIKSGKEPLYSVNTKKFYQTRGK